MDKVLFIDAHNAIWRGNVSFGPVKNHILCSICDKESPRHNLHDVIHCECGARWDQSDNKCYGDKYLLIYNFFRNIRPLIETYQPDKSFFVLEGHPKFRYDLFPDYKANRIIKQASNQDLMDKFQSSKNEIVKLLQYLPVTVVRASNYEADDVIATLCENMKDEKLTVLSTDSDYIQLLQRGYKHCMIYNPIKKEAMAAPTYPYVAWKCLAGDKADNIAGLLKPKKALDTINSPELFAKFMSAEENRANFNINRQLIEFRSVPEEEIIFHEGLRSFNILRQEFHNMDFQSIVNDNSWGKYTKTFDCLRY